MTIVELSDYSMTVMKDSEDPPWVSISRIGKYARLYVESVSTGNMEKPTDFVCSGRMLVLFFKDSISDKFKEKEKITIHGFI